MPSPKLLRTLIAVACALAAWVVAAPARAAAPYCDERGASAIAAPPVFPTDGASIDADDDPAACGDRADATEPVTSAHQGDAPLPEDPGSGTYATLAAPLPLVPRLAAVAPPTTTATPIADGVQTRLERPPR